MDKLAGMVNRVVRELGEKKGKGGMDQEKEQKGQAKDPTWTQHWAQHTQHWAQH
jgi:hypothetical protein